jgi:hypothetical protein
MPAREQRKHPQPARADKPVRRRGFASGERMTKLNIGLNIGAGGRQNVGRVDHVVYEYKSLAAREAAKAEFEQRFGVAGWTDVGLIETFGIQVIVDWDSGMELLCPAADAPGADGEMTGHAHSIVFGVADLDEAVARANRAGARTTPIVLPAWVKEKSADRFSMAREAAINPEDVGGIPIVLGEFAPRPGRELVEQDERGRLHPGGIDHIVYAFANEELLNHARERLTAVLGIEEWDDYGTLEPIAIRVLFAPLAGLELLCPARAGSMLDPFVAKHGQISFFNQSLAVADFDGAMERVRTGGGQAAERPLPPSPGGRYASVRQAEIGTLGGVATTLCERIVHQPAD